MSYYDNFIEYVPLTDETFKNYLCKIKQNDKYALILSLHFIPLIKSIATSLSLNLKDSQDDLIQNGLLSVRKAGLKFAKEYFSDINDMLKLKDNSNLDLKHPKTLATFIQYIKVVIKNDMLETLKDSKSIVTIPKKAFYADVNKYTYTQLDINMEQKPIEQSLNLSKLPYQESPENNYLMNHAIKIINKWMSTLSDYSKDVLLTYVLKNPMGLPKEKVIQKYNVSERTLQRERSRLNNELRKIIKEA